MLRGLLILFFFQFLGECLSQGFALPVPGGVIGMVLLFAALIVRGRVPRDLDSSAPHLLKPLALYFVPASVGVMTMGPLLAQEGVRIVVVLLLATVLPLVVCAYGLDYWLARRGGV